MKSERREWWLEAFSFWGASKVDGSLTFYWFSTLACIPWMDYWTMFLWLYDTRPHHTLEPLCRSRSQQTHCKKTIWMITFRIIIRIFFCISESWTDILLKCHAFEVEVTDLLGRYHFLKCTFSWCFTSTWSSWRRISCLDIQAFSIHN